MSLPDLNPPDRPVRADARRNREKLLTAAQESFAADGDAVTLEAVARAAGVGIGTLYRHFPTREALVEAVYGAELDDVIASAPALLEQQAPDVALRAWMDRYAAFFATKRGMIGTLRPGWASGRIATPRERITVALGAILDEGARTGVLRADADPGDVAMLMLGVFLSTDGADTSGQTSRLLDLVVDGLRPRA